MALLLVATLLAATVDMPEPARCEPPAPHYTGSGAAPRGAQRLDRQPKASHYLALFHSIDGCPAPVIVRTDIGGTTALPDR